MANKYHYEGLGTDRHLVELDTDSPDRILARSEPLHEDDGECDADLMPEDDDANISAQGIRNIPPEALKWLLLYIIPSESSGVRKRWRVAQLRLIVLAHAAGLEGISNRPLTALAEELGVSRALLSLYATKMSDELHQNKVRGGKSRASRQTYRESAIRYHRRAGHNVTADIATASPRQSSRQGEACEA